MTLDRRVTDAVLDAGIDPAMVTVRAADMAASVLGDPVLSKDAATHIVKAFGVHYDITRYPEGGGGTIKGISPDGALTVHYGWQT